jgi:1-acyl-sn-glycerol-3-phosphate acyltransferase
MLLTGIALLAAVFSVAAVMAGELSPALTPVLFIAFSLGLLLLSVGYLWLICAFVDQDKPREEDSPFYRRMMHLYIEALITLVGLKVEVSGLEKTPKSGRFLLVCNHQNESDPGILLHYFKNSQLAFISKQENRDMFAVGKIMHMTLCQLMNRENDREALKTILRCIQILKEDKASIGVFPEGGIKDKDKLSPFRSGVFKMAQKANVPIVVCTLKGTSEVFHNIAKLRPSHVRLHLLDVIPAESLKGRTTVDIAQQVYDMMLADMGPEYALEEM